MTGLKDLLKKKDKIAEDVRATDRPADLQAPEFKIIRTTTESEEVVQPPDFPDNDANSSHNASPRKRHERAHSLGFRKSSNASLTKDPTAQNVPIRPKPEHRLSHRLHLHRRSPSVENSAILPSDLPDAPDTTVIAAPRTSRSSTDAHEAEETAAANEQREAQWEKRATLLAQKNPLVEVGLAQQEVVTPAVERARKRSRSRGSTGKAGIERNDDDIREAIRLHEMGELGLSTAMFGRLADPLGANNALAQVLFGLALRHGWGVPTDGERAVHYLSLAAANSAGVEKEALEAGMTKGGAAKGELVLAIFELANCFRHGWGVAVDAVAARQYYETAANLGDTDAMEEAAWCCLEGFGGGKDKFKAAQYLRLAEEKGHRSVGNSWIWKDKYNPK